MNQPAEPEKRYTFNDPLGGSALQRLRRKDFHAWVLLLSSATVRLKSRFYYPRIFGCFRKSSLLFRPLLLVKPQHIYVGDRVGIQPGARLEVLVLHPENPPQLRIGRNVGIEQNVHIVCHHRVTIGDDVSITANCAIVDTTHPFDDLAPGTKVGDGILDDAAFVEIGEGSFIGFGSVVLPNVRIGKGCVIGANSVVTRSIPDYSVAAGAPAVVLRPVRRVTANLK